MNKQNPVSLEGSGGGGWGGGEVPVAVSLYMTGIFMILLSYIPNLKALC